MGKDFDFPQLEQHLSVLKDIIQQAVPEVKKVTSISTICIAMTSSNYQSTFTEVHKLVHQYMTVPIKSATSERVTSTLRRLLTYLMSSTSKTRLNNCVLLHTHKDLVDSMDLAAIARNFSSLNEERMHYFGSFKG